jgi:hypothetical protein
MTVASAIHSTAVTEKPITSGWRSNCTPVIAPLHIPVDDVGDAGYRAHALDAAYPLTYSIRLARNLA